ncbi:DUF1801 domain-containing protein [Aestuariimicrobium soli]|uniref:DUF1801 domain-containing protein n=1 Tax=Aestuariimicrobium soli TaxID=2035834 RepID=UPI003EBC1C9D
MANKTQPTDVPVDDFIAGLPARRQPEARSLIALMGEISGEQPVMWGPSIIGFGRKQYRYESGRSGEMGLLGFSPRAAKITIYVPEGFDHHTDLLPRLGKHSTSVSCLYLNRLDDADPAVLRELVERSYALAVARPADDTATSADASSAPDAPSTVADYVASVPAAARGHVDALRELVRSELPEAEECLSYGIIGYRTIPKKRARVYVSGWKDHVAVYPIPKDDDLRRELAGHIRGKGTLRFALDEPLPIDLLRRVVQSLAAD